MSSIFEMLFLFWLVVMCLLSSLDDIYACVKLVADNVWEAEYDKTGCLGFRVDSFDRLFLQKRPILLPMGQNSNENLKHDKQG